MDYSKCKFQTKAVHCGQNPDPTTGAIIPPVYLTATYAQEYPNQHKGYDYTRAGNPNFTQVEEQIAAVEDMKFCTVMASGLSCMTALCALACTKHKRVGVFESLYGGTHRLLTRVFNDMGIELSKVKANDYDGLSKLVSNHRIDVFVFESPTNPLLEVIDIQKVTDTIRNSQSKECVIVLDNTFATSVHQSYGHMVDVVWHSNTKFMGGHSDLISGSVCMNDKTLKERMDFYRMAMGMNASPFDCWLLSRSIKTLGIRVDRQSANALTIANFLNDHKRVKRVIYMGLKSHPDHELAKRQMINGFGSIISVEFDLDLQQTMTLISSFTIITLAESLGAVESLVDHPASMTHASISKEVRDEIGLSDGLVRFSIGIEDVEDLKDDITEALKTYE